MSGAMIRNPQQQARPSRVATQARAFSLLSALPFAGGRKEAVRAERKEALLDLLPKVSNNCHELTVISQTRVFCAQVMQG
jgi:hypothetical protein